MRLLGKLRSLWLRLCGQFANRHVEREFAAELESHLAMHIEDGIRAGLTEAEARRQALIRLGGIEQTRQAYRERQGLPSLETLLQDIHFAARMLRKNPGFALIAILTLALGIGANTALFSVVNGVLLNPLPHPHPEELVAVHASKPNFDEGSISYLNFRDWQRDTRTLAALAISTNASFTMTGSGDAERVRGNFVSSDFFPLLGVKPVLGRLFGPGEDEVGRGPVALISAALWARKFGSRPDVIGKTLTLDGRDFSIIGVLPPDFGLSLSNFRAREIYVPIGQWQTKALNDRGAGLGIHGIARLKPGVTLAQAQSDMNTVSDHLAAEFPEDDHGIRAKLVPLRHSIVRDVQPILLVLLGAVGFVLLIACVNVANLLFARSNTRAREFAVRFALGARRSRIIRQLLTESIMLSLSGGALGLLIAGWSTRAALRLSAAALPRASEVQMNAPVLCFTLFLSLVVGVLFGSFPALNISQSKLHETLKEGGRGASGTRHRVQDSLVIVEVAMALVLLAGAGLMIRSLVALSRVDPGFQPHGVVTFDIAVPYFPKTVTPEGARAWMEEIHRRIEHVPGIKAVSFSWSAIPMTGGEDEQLFWLENEPKPTNANGMHWALRYTVEPDYLKVMQIPLLRGRFFTEADDEHTPLVAVVDDVFARKYFGDGDPIGKQLNSDDYDRKVTIVGVTGHVMHWGLDNDSGSPLHAEIYFSFGQLRGWQLVSTTGVAVDVIARASNPTTVFADIQQAMRAMDQEQVAYGAVTMDEMIARTLAARRFSMILLTVFAIVALLLASIGMYGVISYVVGQRTQEIGIRMALGANRRDVLRWVLGAGGRLALTGAAAGLFVSLFLTRFLAASALIYGVRPYDPWTLTAVTTLLLLVAVAACYVPARRATHIDPMQALRAE